MKQEANEATFTIFVQLHAQIDVTPPWEMANELHHALAQFPALP